MIGKMAKHLPSNHEPSRLPIVLKPRLIELCFQTAGLWEMGVLGRMGLPQHIDELMFYRTPDVEASALYAIVTPDSSHTSFDAEVMTTSGQLLFRLRGYRTVELPSTLDEKQLMHLKAVMTLRAVAA